MNGKGSKRRPAFIPMHEFGDNWAKIFEKPKQKEQENVDSKRTESGEREPDNNGRDGRND